ncbi:MAG: hypothetical protein NZ930_01580 [Candidatus Bipolaricaulota bacterium]|nr:hypothetical protein [Candidatus Bipolaricaulota bacterium]MDW8031705.1 hypothetical protein [Candidatus Bipolaricaulota bacterium]
MVEAQARAAQEDLTSLSVWVTATSVAHKISFSPAQVDFGSGLLVLREQCNSMGMFGLGTDKVGLPIENSSGDYGWYYTSAGFPQPSPELRQKCEGG